MREIHLEELKNIQIQILDKVHEYCLEHGIIYFLSSGTLIGAVRHKGYIPWDDDIDIYMPRQDFERFIRQFNGVNKTYRCISLAEDTNCTIAYAKVERTDTRLVEAVDNPREQGINIDIFPIDGVPDDEEARSKYFSKVQHIRNKMIMKDVKINFHRRGIFKNLILLGGKALLFNKRLHQLAVDLDNVIDKHANDTLYVCNMILGNGLHTEFRRDVINGTVDIEFEGKYYKTMKGYDEYLTKTYGDYMQLPPEDKRVSHHAFKAYWI